VAATAITFVTPVDGDAALFDVQPSTFTTNPPLGQTYSDELRLAYVVTDAQFDVEGEANRNIAQIKQYLDNMRPSAEQLKGELEQLGASLVERRKQERGAHSQIVAGLKTPIRI